eukprot:scaffold154250_cov19-Tisochrysis_lutea.AAC.2
MDYQGRSRIEPRSQVVCMGKQGRAQGHITEFHAWTTKVDQARSHITELCAWTTGVARGALQVLTPRKAWVKRTKRMQPTCLPAHAKGMGEKDQKDAAHMPACACKCHSEWHVDHIMGCFQQHNERQYENGDVTCQTGMPNRDGEWEPSCLLSERDPRAGKEVAQ